MLFSFICQARQDGLRNVLIIHGKGREDNAHANIVRSYVARWLTEFDDVQAYCTALLIMAAAERVMLRCVKRRRQSRKTGSATRNAAVKGLHRLLTGSL
ncbi:Probable DNA endonuclease SmrA [Citrobacter koseri]|uniref:Probable DNA endonuclease SmrA n=1 Tax=Citrobacter koseri TaxID=545 RepID=A0A2X2WHQ4_CITKO|nr:Probable DNA endonuclease SmrA [Citrobacter koseri]